MAAFDSDTDLYSYFRQEAQKLNCKVCFDKKQDKINKMNNKGSGGVPACLCKVNTPCPCDDVKEDLERDGVCYCVVFEKV